MFRCPHCNKPGISSLSKAILSPGHPVTCKSCGGISCIRYPSWLAAMLPGTVLMIAAMFAASESLEWGLDIAGVILMVVIPFLYTPQHMKNE